MLTICWALFKSNGYAFNIWPFGRALSTVCLCRDLFLNNLYFRKILD